MLNQRESAHSINKKAELRDEDKTKDELIAELRALREHQKEENQPQFFADFFLDQYHYVEKKEHLLIDLFDAGIWTCALPDDEFYFSSKWKSIIGFEIHEIENCKETWFGRVHPEDAEELKQKFEKLKNREIGEFDSEHRIKHKNGSFHWMNCKARILKSVSANQHLILGVLRDISHRKSQENKLRENEEHYRSLVENTPVCVHEIDLNGQLTSMNPAGLKMLGLADERDIYGVEYCSYSSRQDRQRIEKLMEAAIAGKPSSFEFCSEGTPARTFKSCFVPIRNSNGAVIKLMGLTEDITELKETQLQLRQAQKLETIGTLTGGIAHEFNNLLTPILGYSEMLMGNKCEDDPDIVDLVQIHKSVNRARDLVQKMLTYGRQNVSARTSVRLESLTEETCKLLKKTIPRNISFKTDFEENLPAIHGNSNEIHQILVNLAINASHAMTDGGELTIQLKYSGFQHFAGLEDRGREGSYVSLAVQDTGVGMDQKILEKIYDPFFTTKKIGQGTGLGLSVVQGIVDQHEGHIGVESLPGKGTTFTVYFPVSKEIVNRSETKIQALANGCERILLIDDEEIILQMTRKILKKFNYEVTGFLDSQEAIEFFSENSQNFDLVMTDYGMPKLNGKQISEQIKKIRPDIKIILLTGYADLVNSTNSEEWGIDALLSKPYNVNEINAIVRNTLGSGTIPTAHAN
ncbi:MAG: PAS domain S-box protein [SAR324 cluster bacterium]|nr:PAS domain S-box protein [SAR324 cluster bacterium]